MRIFAAVLLIVACNSASKPPGPTPGSGGSIGSPAGMGGSSPTGGAAGAPQIDAAPAIDASPDAPAMTMMADAAVAAAPDAGVDASAASDGLSAGIPGHEWVIPCDPAWSKAQCCAHYCGCMATNCADRAPKDCQATCEAGDGMLKCKVEQCFESLDPRFPQDHGSHCGHATEAAHCQGIIP